MSEHLDRLRAAWAAERDWQRAELEALRKRPLAEQVVAGVTWPVLDARDAEPAGRGRWRWQLRSRAPLHDGIGPGEAVEVSSAGGGAVWRGRVSFVEGCVAEVSLDTDELPPQVRVTRRFDPSTFERYEIALRAGYESKAPVAQILDGRATWPMPIELPEVTAPGLHEAQRRAVAMSLAAPHLSVIHGPPGTGKTRTLVTLLKALVAGGEKPWALADSNAAVDHLADRADAAGLRVLRVGSAERIGGRVAHLSLDAATARHPTAPAIAAIDKEISRCKGPKAHIERRRLLGERARLEDEARRDALRDADVLALTFGTLARLGRELPPTRTAVVDEATQAVEPAVWVAAHLVQRVILAGDPKQLGPVVFQPNNPLGDSLLHRLLRAPAPDAAVVMLEQQHRMHADVHALVQDVYGPRYTPHASVASADLRGLLGQIDAADAGVVRWIDTAGAGLDEQRDPASGSLFNRGEVDVVARVVEAWRRAGLAADAIGVLAPYSAQVERLRLDPRLAGVEVGTVNAFQGREKEAIVVSFVRSNPEAELGFVADPRRLVVALTRARRAWVGVGDSATLAMFPPIAAVIDLVSAAGGLESVFEERWGL